MEYILNKINRITREKIVKTTKIDKVHKLDSYNIKAYKRNNKKLNSNNDDSEDYIVTAVKETNEKDRGRFLDRLE